MGIHFAASQHSANTRCWGVCCKYLQKRVPNTWTFLGLWLNSIFGAPARTPEAQRSTFRGGPSAPGALCFLVPKGCTAAGWKIHQQLDSEPANSPLSILAVVARNEIVASRNAHTLQGGRVWEACVFRESG